MKIAEYLEDKFKNANGVFYNYSPNNEFEKIYIKLRAAEGRCYTDNEVKKLPEVSLFHKHHDEWHIRKMSSQKLINYLRDKTKNKTLLDLGCGNGWLSNKLASLPECEVIGMDINKIELEQAARIFDKGNLFFVLGDANNLDFRYEFIILAASAAYFSNLNILISELLKKLEPSGEIHLIDNPFYSDTQKAKQESLKYYNSLGFSEMITYYHHHSLNELSEFNYEVLHSPDTFINRIKRKPE